MDCSDIPCHHSCIAEIPVTEGFKANSIVAENIRLQIVEREREIVPL